MSMSKSPRKIAHSTRYEATLKHSKVKLGRTGLEHLTPTERRRQSHWIFNSATFSDSPLFTRPAGVGACFIWAQAQAAFYRGSLHAPRCGSKGRPSSFGAGVAAAAVRATRLCGRGVASFGHSYWPVCALKVRASRPVLKMRKLARGLSSELQPAQSAKAVVARRCGSFMRWCGWWVDLWIDGRAS